MYLLVGEWEAHFLAEEFGKCFGVHEIVFQIPQETDVHLRRLRGLRRLRRLTERTELTGLARLSRAGRIAHARVGLEGRGAEVGRMR